MRKPFLLTVIFLLSVSLTFPLSPADASEKERVTVSILNSAEKFFLSLKQRDFETAWNILSQRSREAITNNVYETSAKIGATLSREDIIRDFERRGIMFRNYWKSFLRNFDTDIVLEHSLWKMGTIKKTKAEIIIQYDKDSNPTILKMFKENDAWKVGLNETFSRGTLEKWLDYFKRMNGA